MTKRSLGAHYLQQLLEFSIYKSQQFPPLKKGRKKPVGKTQIYSFLTPDNKPVDNKTTNLPTLFLNTTAQ